VIPGETGSLSEKCGGKGSRQEWIQSVRVSGSDEMEMKSQVTSGRSKEAFRRVGQIT